MSVDADLEPSRRGVPQKGAVIDHGSLKHGRSSGVGWFWSFFEISLWLSRASLLSPTHTHTLTHTHTHNHTHTHTHTHTWLNLAKFSSSVKIEC